jgi:hypothetical protein
MIKHVLLICLFVKTNYSFSQDLYSTRDLKEGKFKEGSSYNYLLPFENKKKVFLVQGYESKFFSHKGERALDFKVKKGTKVCAAGDSVVISMREDSDKDGLKK